MTTSTDRPRRALVTGASSGIGGATVRRLRADGWDVVATARRADRLAALAEETGADTFVADVTVDEDVSALLAHVRATGGLDAVVNNAGGAFGLDTVEEADLDGWRAMYELNVLGTLRVTQGVLPLLRERGAGDVLVVTSTAGHGPYPGGAGYTGVKHAERMLATTLRWELVGEPIRVIEVAPGAVATEEFSLVRFGGDAQRAAQVYEGYQPLVADDVADTIAWSLSRPAHVNVDLLVVRPRAQANNTTTARTGV
ncbi:SDR family oxidoreductase [Cellulomonas wangsupingiae]|uniref:SDR family NAD(P)-dependent oxidoreductase n=1 Tax=Cellulomonas wangsupingiae TaxID=2968085 RepID=A0ABY5K7S6_9CELL|nr:SDR family NAD(P)-dependent oxidoreductase [Cellulomonas wangsupingiae]MCC2335355.1 SDR family NAD(P)-dependent oxidoreductase [Cellulomonas wangsupingiae]UUI66511.1 SDR family NAD(P)-dependent oxidoreductase [Cellulomonas wangsupingiae]